jgi:hypothetical protein
MWVNEDRRQSQEETIHPLSGSLFRAWEEMRGPHSAPSRHDLDLARVRKLVPYLFIAEHMGESNAFRWRLAGTAVCALLGREVTGSEVTDGWDGFEANLIRRFLSGVSGTHKPAQLRLRFTTDRGQHIVAEMAAFPLTAADGHSTQVMGGLFAFADPDIKHYDRIVAREIVSTRNAAGEAAAEALTAGKPRLRVITGGRGA